MKAIPGARLVVIPDARHMLPVERPEPYNDAVMEFLASVSKPVRSPESPAASAEAVRG
jgi:hypothetical protein